MKKENIAIKILKILGTYLAGCLLWLLIFSTFMPADETGATSEPFQGAICVFGIMTATLLLFQIVFLENCLNLMMSNSIMMMKKKKLQMKN